MNIPWPSNNLVTAIKQAESYGLLGKISPEPIFHFNIKISTAAAPLSAANPRP
jgi:NADH:ubiquinone oxidoreductase subunit F (NADH-binding)